MLVYWSSTYHTGVFLKGMNFEKKVASKIKKLYAISKLKNSKLKFIEQVNWIGYLDYLTRTRQSFTNERDLFL